MQCSECEALKAELAEFEEVSRELQIELERDLASMEKSEMNMRLSSERAKSDLDNLQSVYNSKLREHTTTLGQMTRELDLTRTAEKALRSQLRDMELDNDDLEKSERAKDSSLQDFESRYGRAIERIAMLEEELVNKAALEEELQRLKDELRDQEEELAVIRTQQATIYSAPLTPPRTESVTTSNESTSPTAFATHENATPRKSETINFVQDSIQDSPSIAVTSPTPGRPTRSVSLSQKYRSPPSAESKSTTSQVTPLARSFRTVSGTPTSTTSSIREKRHNLVLDDMKGMTSRIQQLTTRRNQIMAGSSIPRASISSPASTRIIGVGRNSEVKRTISLGLSIPAGATSPTTANRSSRLRTTEPEGFAGLERSNRHSRTISVDSNAPFLSRPASRSSMRASVSGSASQRTSIPTRPNSRLSMSSSTGISLTNSPPPPVPRTFPSRSSTPTFTRPPTPSLSTTTRKPWGSNAPPPIPTPGQSNRRRLLSTAGTTPARVRGSVDLNVEEKAPLARRASMGLSKSIRK